ncbi:CLUMA_CG004026, isoform A [Clunio marinus]|uniref:WD repeat-containing protein 89 n=1 Tax=Clunio marinus TaxID=568069 RepID=A0A1J1HSM4_9DIPT|nr:CLUMA_CG004026, isoform A [Clunio marinus]
MALNFDVNIESESEEDPFEDGNTVKNIQEHFRHEFTQVHQEATSLKRKYITHAANSNDFSKISIGIGNEMQVYDVTESGLNKYVGKNEFGQFEHPVSGLKFFHDDPNIVFASTSAGEIHMYDLRSFSRIHTFEDDSELIVKPVNCFDVNANDRLLCAGSDELNHNVYLMFFDIRERRFMGGYFESHQEEVTDVKFHPTDPDTLCSGSTDGLINIFDCKKEKEEDALQFSLNTEDSIAKLQWHYHDKLSCITNTNELLLYDANEHDLLKKWNRSSITEAIKRKSVIDCNLIDCYNYGTDEMLLLATSNYNKGECIRSVTFSENTLDPVGNFSGNSQIIRASLYNAKENLFFTFGEGAIISLWKESESAATNMNVSLKEDSSVKKKLKKKSNPY